MLIWLAALLAAALFVEGVRATFFRRIAEPSLSAAPRAETASARRRLAADKPVARKRTPRPLTRLKPLLPGIHRQPFYFARPDVYDILPEIPEIEYAETADSREPPHLRIAS